MQNPSEEKFRRINGDNAVFRSKVADLPASLDFLIQLGFQKQENTNILIMPAENVQMESLNAAGGLLTNAITNPMFGVL